MKPYIRIIAPNLLYYIGYLSPLGPGGIGALTAAPFIISQAPMSEVDETHEGIHVYQQYECGLVGGLVAVPALLLLGVPWWVAVIVGIAGFLPLIGWLSLVYAVTWIYWTLTSRQDDYKGLTPGKRGYYLIPFEREAYLYDGDGFDYFGQRRWFAWVRIAPHEVARPGTELSEELYLHYRDSHVLGNLFTRRR